MHSTFCEHSNYINVPTRLAKRYRKDKDGWDMLVLAICLKLRSTSSGMYVRTPYALMKELRCSHRKAERLIKKASHSELFHFNARTKFLSAKSFKAGASWYEANNGKRYYYDAVIVIEKNADGAISHKDISRQLRDRMMLRLLSAKSSSDELLCHKNSVQRREKPLTHKFLANVAGVHRSTATRHLCRLSNEKSEERIMDVTRHPIIYVYDFDHDCVITTVEGRRTFVSGRYACVRDANDYSFVDPNHYKMFKHVIYNHPKRRTENRVRRFHWEY